MTDVLSAAAVSIATAAGTEEHNATIVPPLVWGIGAFVIFMVLLAATLAFGRGR